MNAAARSHGWLTYSAITVLSALLFGLFSPGVLAQTPGSVEFTTNDPSPYAIDWDTLGQAPKIFTLNNLGNKPLRLQIKLGDFIGPDQKSEAVDLSHYLTIDPPGGLDLKPAASAQFKITARAGAGVPLPPTGNYTGFLTVTDENSQLITRKQIKVGFPEVRSAPSPAVTRLYVRVWRAWPFPFCSTLFGEDSFRIPLKQRVMSVAQETPRFFTLSRSLGGEAAARWIDDPAERKEDEPSIKLRLEGITHAGQYDGALNFSPRTASALSGAASIASLTNIPLIGGDSVQITVLATDIVIWPVIVLVSAIIISQATKYYLNVKRQIWDWRKQEAELGVSYRQEAREFSRVAAEHHLYTAYSIDEDLLERRKAILKRIKEVEEVSWLTPQESRTAAERPLSEELRWLVTRISTWGQFPVVVIKLRDELTRAYTNDSARAVLITTGMNTGKQPEVVTECSGAVGGEAIGVADIDVVAAKLTGQAAFLQSWGALYKRAVYCRDRIAEIQRSDAQATSADGKLNETDRQKLADIKQKLEKVFLDLWQVKTNDSNTLQTTDQSIDEIEGTLYQFANKADAIALLTIGTESVDTVLAPQPTAAHLSQTLVDKLGTRSLEIGNWQQRRRNDDALRAKHYRAAMRQWDLVTAGIGALVALMSGLQLYYFGKNFGTLQDYATLFVWGAGTQVAIEMLSAALGRLIPPLKMSAVVGGSTTR